MKPVHLLYAAFLAAMLLTAPLGAKPVNPPLPAPDWTLPDPDGKQVSAADFKGKVVVVDFWATWCPPCKVEIPGYITLQKKYAGDVVFIGISLAIVAIALASSFIPARRASHVDPMQALRSE